jgi:hypothetical protein
MSNQFLEVLSWLLHSQHQDYGLLSPVRRLEQVVEFEDALVRLVWEVFVHAPCVEIPHRCKAHDVQSARTQDNKVDSSVHLFHESRLFRPAF